MRGRVVTVFVASWRYVAAMRARQLDSGMRSGRQIVGAEKGPLPSDRESFVVRAVTEGRREVFKSGVGHAGGSGYRLCSQVGQVQNGVLHVRQTTSKAERVVEILFTAHTIHHF